MNNSLVLNPQYLYSDNNKEICLFNSQSGSGTLLRGIEAELFRKIYTKLNLIKDITLEYSDMEGNFIKVLKRKEYINRKA